MKDYNQRRAAIAAAMNDLAQYATSGLLAPLFALLDELIEEAMHDLITVVPDKLQRKQGILAQLMALKIALRDPTTHQSPLAA